MGEMADGITRVLGSEEENAMDEDIGCDCSYVNLFQDYNVSRQLTPEKSSFRGRLVIEPVLISKTTSFPASDPTATSFPSVHNAVMLSSSSYTN